MGFAPERQEPEDQAEERELQTVSVPFNEEEQS